ncbi:MAG: PEP-utilizing enzyme [Desulforhopalus sp.]|nr:PEP-utilizing enzyme [Desulforhopalus sp.]
MKNLLNLFTRGERCTPLSGGSGVHIEKYRHFRDFLAGNRDALRLLSAMEMLYYSGKAFTAADIAFHYEGLYGHLQQLLRALNGLADQRYLALFDAATKINAAVRATLRPVIYRLEIPAIVPLTELAQQAQATAGGKAANLAAIDRQTGLRVPAGFVVTASGYDRFLRYNGIDQLVLDELAGISPGDTGLAEVSDRLTRLILAAHVPDELATLLYAHYDAIERRTGPGLHLAMRSSAVREDSESSFAGQYRSVLGVSRRQLIAAYKEVVASSFSPHAISYRQMAGIDITETPMCVLGLAMVAAEASGVLYTSDPSGKAPETMQVNAVLGLGEQLVSGASAADTYILDRSTGELMEQRLADKVSRLDTAIEGTVEHRVERRESSRATLDREELAELTDIGRRLEQVFGGPQDIEWAINSRREISILQCRPLQVAARVVDQPVEADAGALIVRGGIVASQGLAAGIASVAYDNQSLADIPDQALLVTKTASPRYAEVMGRIRGLVSESGTAMCHLASVAREFEVPMAAGVAGATQLIAAGELVTLLAQGEPAVYRGDFLKGRQAGTGKKRMINSAVHEKMRAVLDHLAPLHLTDPDAPGFLPENCTSLHDIIRLAHEQAVREMFSLSNLAEDQTAAVQLTTHLPLSLHLIDLGGGLSPGLSTCDTVRAEHFTSEPLKALWRGFSHPGINWRGSVQFDGGSLLSRLAAPATAEFGTAPGGNSYALVGSDYLNFSAKFGYHYATLDTLCGDDPDHNYLTLQFSGGAGSYSGKTLRIQFLGKILGGLGCVVSLQGDLLEASLSRHPRGEMLERLDIIGRLLASSRLLDMAITGQQDVDDLAEAFLRGDYDLLHHREASGLPGFHINTGTWQLTGEDGAVCCLADGSQLLSALSVNVAGLIGKTFGRKYQDMLDTLGAYYTFPLAVARMGACGDGEISLMVKPLRGVIDQAGGLAFGLRDSGNYFALRVNALEDNIILFEFLDNRRLERARVKTTVAPGTWYCLGATVNGKQITCLLDGKQVFSYLSARPVTGHIGLWSKADSVTLFKELLVADDTGCRSIIAAGKSPGNPA